MHCIRPTHAARFLTGGVGGGGKKGEGEGERKKRGDGSSCWSMRVAQWNTDLDFGAKKSAV